jgi:hypothetical protein
MMMAMMAAATDTAASTLLATGEPVGAARKLVGCRLGPLGVAPTQLVHIVGQPGSALPDVRRKLVVFLDQLLIGGSAKLLNAKGALPVLECVDLLDEVAAVQQ